MACLLACCDRRYNLVVCYYALGDKDKMKKGFVRLCSIPLPGSADDEDEDVRCATVKVAHPLPLFVSSNALTVCAESIGSASADPFV